MKEKRHKIGKNQPKRQKNTTEFIFCGIFSINDYECHFLLFFKNRTYKFKILNNQILDMK